MGLHVDNLTMGIMRWGAKKDFVELELRTYLNLRTSPERKDLEISKNVAIAAFWENSENVWPTFRKIQQHSGKFAKKKQQISAILNF